MVGTTFLPSSPGLDGETLDELYGRDYGLEYATDIGELAGDEDDLALLDAAAQQDQLPGDYADEQQPGKILLGGEGQEEEDGDQALASTAGKDGSGQDLQEGQVVVDQDANPSGSGSGGGDGGVSPVMEQGEDLIESSGAVGQDVDDEEESEEEEEDEDGSDYDEGDDEDEEDEEEEEETSMERSHRKLEMVAKLGGLGIERKTCWQ